MEQEKKSSREKVREGAAAWYDYVGLGICANAVLT